MYYEDGKGRGHRTVKKIYIYILERMRWRNENVLKKYDKKKNNNNKTNRATVLILNIVSSNIHVCVIA